MKLDYNMGVDFATTMVGYIIHLNAVSFSNLKMMEEEYHIDPLSLSLKLLNTKSRISVQEYLTHNLSIYSIEYEDGREIISESFSAYYSSTGNKFATEFVQECKLQVKERR